MIELRPHQLEALDAMSDSDKGQIIVPTGGGKTMCMIEDVKRQFKSSVSKTIVVVAPRILLANQLCSEFLSKILMATIMLVLMSFMFIVERHTSIVQPSQIISSSGIIVALSISLCLLPTTHYIRYKIH